MLRSVVCRGGSPTRNDIPGVLHSIQRGSQGRTRRGPASGGDPPAKRVFRSDDVDASTPPNTSRALGRRCQHETTGTEDRRGQPAANETTRRFRQTQPRRPEHTAMSDSRKALVKRLVEGLFQPVRVAHREIAGPLQWFREVAQSTL